MAKVESVSLGNSNPKPSPTPGPPAGPPAGPRSATVNILPDPANASPVRIQGTVTFMQDSESALLVVTANVTGIPTAEHGWHVHHLETHFQIVVQLDPHWNPFGVNHGAPDADTSLAEPWFYMAELMIWRITENPLSLTTGNAGSRLACGVIGFS
ncbi:hypothetical protein BASA62_007780 [Batrachochytrium salamandrivorans]|nr:hypothetical protein BASA62_007780 [Batrachochytrium salamandrivorans]